MAEVKLDNLIEKLRQEGVENAQQKADEIINNAKKEADQIVKDAEKKADDIVSKGEQKAQQFQQNAELAVKQAERDGELLFKNRINDIFDRVFKRDVGQALDAEVMKDMILKVVDKWTDKPEVEVKVSKDDKKKLEKVLFSSLKKDVKEGIEIKVGQDISNGFRIGMKNENVYYDFTDESIAAIMKSNLNPRLKQILDNE